jgi:pyrroloquinoline quinone biosynthesis protein D
MISAPEKPKLSKLFRFQREEAQNCYVLLYPEGMVKLNQSAAEILKRCDGNRAVNDIIADLEQAFSTSGIADDVRTFLHDATARGWLV